MADFEQDPRVASLLAEAGDEVTNLIRPPGVAEAEATVRHRRRNRILGAAVLAAVLESAPVVAVDLAGRHTEPPPAGRRPSTSASTYPSASPSETASGPAASAAPDGRISAGDLSNATLRIPAWPKGFDDGCATGSVKFSNGQSGLVSQRGAPVYVDVDRDGAQETAMLIACTPQGADYQVLVFDRTAGGNIVTLGKVVGSAGNLGRAGTDIMTIWSIQAGDNGQIRVDVGEYRPCCGAAQASQHQWRTYGWNGSGFTQTGGPTAFGPNPKVTKLTLTAGPVTMTRQPDGTWQGDLRVTIHNAAAYATPGQLDFELSVDQAWQAQPAANSGCQFTPGESPLGCLLPVLPAGADRAVTVHLTARAGTLATNCTVYALAVDGNRAGYPGTTSTGVQIVQG